MFKVHTCGVCTVALILSFHLHGVCFFETAVCLPEQLSSRKQQPFNKHPLLLQLFCLQVQAPTRGAHASRLSLSLSLLPRFFQRPASSSFPVFFCIVCACPTLHAVCCLQEALVSSLQVENQALQAALERLRHDFQEERTLRLQREKKAGPAASAAAAKQKAPPSTPSRGEGGRAGLGIMGRRNLLSRNSLPAEGAQTPSRGPGSVLSGPGMHNHNVRSTPHRARSSGGVGPAAAAAAAAAGWESNHGGIGSRHSVPTMSEVESGAAAGNEEGEALPWVLNTDQVSFVHTYV